MTHANGGGIIGGYPLCGNNKEGNATDTDSKADCEKCLSIMVPYALKKGWKMEPNMVAYQKKYDIK